MVLAGVGIGIVATMISGGMVGRIHQTTMGSTVIIGAMLVDMESLAKEAMGNKAITGAMSLNMESLEKEAGVMLVNTESLAKGRVQR